MKGFVAEEKQGLGDVFSGCIINSNMTVIIIDGVLSYYENHNTYVFFIQLFPSMALSSVTLPSGGSTMVGLLAATA